MSSHTKQPIAEQDLAAQQRVMRQRKITVEVLTKYREMKELPDGWSFRYPASEPWPTKLKEFAEFQQRCYPLFAFTCVSDQGRESLWLQIQGPQKDKDFGKTFARAVYKKRGRAAVVKQRIHGNLRVLTSPLRSMPEFLIIGAAKCGTSSLYFYLTQHPCVAPAFKKEVYFFDRGFSKGYGWYRAHFPTLMTKRSGGKSRITGEATPCYIFHPHAAKRIAECVPDVKLIALLRNPVDRAYSYYHQKLRSGHETLSFEAAIESEEARLHGELDRMIADENYFSFNRQNYSYLARGVYADGLKVWLDSFPREQMLILATEDFSKNRQQTLERVMQFLELPNLELNDRRKYNSIPYPKIEAKLRKRLIEYFEPHNERLYKLLDMKFDWDR